MIPVGTKIGNVSPVFPKIEPFVEEKKDSSTSSSSPVLSNDLTKEDIDRLIRETGSGIRDLKAKKADKESLKPLIDSLLVYKNRYKELNGGVDWSDKTSA